MPKFDKDKMAEICDTYGVQSLQFDRDGNLFAMINGNTFPVVGERVHFGKSDADLAADAIDKAKNAP